MRTCVFYVYEQLVPTEGLRGLFRAYDLVAFTEVNNFLSCPNLMTFFTCATSPYLSTFSSRPTICYLSTAMTVWAIHITSISKIQKYVNMLTLGY